MDFFKKFLPGFKRPAVNCFMLFHKCGNNYSIDLHKHTKNICYVSNVTIDTADKINGLHRRDIANARCRNFDVETLRRHGILTREDARFLVFTRHPASFVLSATKYHLRGDEKWARTTPQPHLGGRSLTDALRAAGDEGERQIITMTHFAWLFERMVSFVPYFDDPRFKRLKVEDLFTTKDVSYYQDIASFLRLEGHSGFLDALKNASPAFKTDLPRHSTGTFRREGDPLEKLEAVARDHYMMNWQTYSDRLGY
ncbi:hypothetical protein FJU08_21130 [Martelella alba]|uniref:Sulfotransferase family protein n=1 Tax=Martelella alba TaxID=2590451 RepID=A0A506U3I3_9HYPH|nr:hypothetical protein [Martelella alba]TPW27109.1 hypothetical protein FJU08_21130 [Martelella alba]